MEDGVPETMSSHILFYVNGREVRVSQPDPEMTLLYFLRNEMHLTGTKLGCGEGGCGACTVMASRYMAVGSSKEIRHAALNACLAPLCAMDGLAITTVEGIGSTRTSLHPVQERIARAHGSQCGFCTPGIVMSMYSLLRNNLLPTEEELEIAFEGNLCRCTGYRPILEGYKTFTKGCCGSGKCCADRKTDKSSVVLFDASSFAPLDPTQEPIFPPALMISGSPKPLAIRGPRVQWYRPVTLDQLLCLREKFPAEPSSPDHKGPCSRLVVGNTEIGVEVKFKNALFEVLICPSEVPELCCLETSGEGLVVGAAVTLDQLEAKLLKLKDELPEHKTRLFCALLEMLRWFAGKQIRNVASLAGNVVNASPISDLNPTLVAGKAQLNLASKESNRTIVLDAGFFTGYRKTTLKPNEVVVSILLPFSREQEFIYSYKQARRRADDIAIVNAGLQVVFSPSSSSPGSLTVEECTLCYGGMSYRTVTATKTQSALIGRQWNRDTLKEACTLLLEDLPLALDAPGGMVEYRKALVLSFFFKFYMTVLSRVFPNPLSPEESSVTQVFQREPTRGSQGFDEIPHLQETKGEGGGGGGGGGGGEGGGCVVVGKPIMHLSAMKQATGEARYLDDIPRYERELYAGLVLSTHAHARIISVDPSAALEMEGVETFVSVEDVPGSNVTGPANDEQVFADGKVTCVGQLIGLVLAKDQPLAQRAAKAVEVTYDDLPTVITIEEAIASNSFFPNSDTKISCGDAEKALEGAEQILEGEFYMGGQDHFYLETIACLAVPKGEDGEMEIIASTQGLDITQKLAAKALGVPSNRIVARVKRIGGGFGGKETRSIFLSTPVAVAANKVRTPVRVMLDRKEDMIASGGRHPFLCKYKVGFTDEGKLTVLKLEMYCSGGNSLDLSFGVLLRAVTHSDNVYKIPNTLVNGRICRTNLPSNTAFRGFGGPQGMLITEHILDSVASRLRLPAEQVRELNLYRDGDCTPFGQLQPECHIRRCWSTMMEKAEFSNRRVKVDDFNKSNKWRKRGLAVVPTKYGIAFGLRLLNQGGALVHIYTDGSVLLTHGGMEMGQGIHTKVVQVCSRCLGGLPLERIHVSETSTDKVPNTSPTAASSSSDLYGAAVKDACEQIMKRLHRFREADPTAGWDTWVKRAYEDRVNLSAQGFYATPGLTFEPSTGKGNLYNYFCYGAGCCEVEVDTLTGDFSVLRADLLMDTGNSLNPAIDIGQVEGAFTQGMGWLTTEECVYLEGGRNTPRGQTFTTGPGTYKIPSFSDVPVEMNVHLMDRTPNPNAIFSSKAVGEPPLFLAASVFFAIKDAIRACRLQNGRSGHFRLDSPATAERIRMACLDQFTDKVCGEAHQAKSKRWNIPL